MPGRMRAWSVTDSSHTEQFADVSTSDRELVMVGQLSSTSAYMADLSGHQQALARSRRKSHRSTFRHLSR